MSETPLYGSVPSAVSVPTASSTDAPKRKTRIHHLAEMKQNGERWSMLTAYDYSTARIFEDAGIPVLLVGDSAANVVYGYDTTVPITVDELLPLVRGVVRGAPHALVVADLPFGTYEGSAEQALATATRFMKEGLAHAVKLEGGERMSKQIAAITSAGIPVMAHVRIHPAERELARRIPRPGSRRRGRAACGGRHCSPGSRGVLRRHGNGSGRDCGPGQPQTHHPHRRHRGRFRMRRSGTRLAGHGGLHER